MGLSPVVFNCPGKTARGMPFESMTGALSAATIYGVLKQSRVRFMARARIQPLAPDAQQLRIDAYRNGVDIGTSTSSTSSAPFMDSLTAVTLKGKVAPPVLLSSLASSSTSSLPQLLALVDDRGKGPAEHMDPGERVR